MAKSKVSTPVADSTPNNVRFHVTEGMRPSTVGTAGRRLFAHTYAFLFASGMIDGAAIPSAKVKEVIGETAIKWHAAQGRFERTAKGITLTPDGFAHFIVRSADPEELAACSAMLTEGTVPSWVKNPANVKPVKA